MGAGQDPRQTAALVGIPNRNHQRPTVVAGCDAQRGYMRLSQKTLAFIA
jgi:hypothetical protein